MAGPSRTTTSQATQLRDTDSSSLWTVGLDLWAGRKASRELSEPGDREALKSATELRVRINIAMAIAAVALLAPFGVNNLIQGRTALGAASFAILVAQGMNAWLMLRGKPTKWLVTLFAAPAILAFLVLCFFQQGVIAALWSYPAVIFFHFGLSPKRARIASILTIAVVVPCSWMVLTSAVAVRYAATLVVVSVFSSIFVCIVTRQQARLRHMTVTDPLTGASNRTILGSSLEIAVAQSRRVGSPTCLVVLDLDDFKSINDSFGHAAGDQVLRVVGSELRRGLRKTDQVFRIGGEEFLVLLPGASLAEARRIAEMLRLTIEKLDLLEARHITASFGVACLRPDESWESWFHRCDRLLYQSKHSGKNRVTVESLWRPESHARPVEASPAHADPESSDSDGGSSAGSWEETSLLLKA